MGRRIREYAAGTLGLTLALCFIATAVPAQQSKVRKIDKGKLNEAIYGMKARDFLTGERKMTMREMPAYVRVFPQTLARYSTGKQPRKMALMRDATYRREDSQEPLIRNASMVMAQDTGRSTARLAREVRNELQTLPYYSVFDWLEFEVRPGGVVVLNGQVTSPPDTKSRAEASVKDVEGVTRVVNQIEVLPVSPNDQRLREALYRAIYSGPLFRYQVGSLQSIHIIVDRGRATLKGWVANEGDKTIAYTRARGVPGLFEVKNELRVEKSEAR
ncbi:MAG: BON domain-containing protein [Pyrinomonadaceae bacterium]